MQRIKEDLHGLVEFTGADDSEAEIILAVMGCGNACAEVGEIKRKQIILITGDREAVAVTEEIKRKHTVSE